MIAFSAGLSGYKVIFLSELLVAEALAVYTFEKKRRFGLRLAVSLAGVYLFAFFYPVVFGGDVFNSAYVSFMFLGLFAATVVAMKICFDEPTVNLIFGGAVAYTVQHISYMTYYFFVSVTGIGSIDVYGSTDIKGSYSVFSLLVYFASYGLIYWFVWAFVEHEMREREKLKVDIFLLLSFVGIMLTDVVLNAVVTYMLRPPLLGTAVIYLYSLLSGAFAMGILYSLLKKDVVESEREMIYFLWQQDKKNYEQSRQNVEMINIKCHDLKHQLRALERRAGMAVDKEYLDELAKSIDIYDTSVRTGNDVVDVILAEKSMFVAEHGIHLSCMIDGERLSFLSSSDLYSLFGNALSNAFEAVEQIVDEARRIVRVRVHVVGRTLLIHVENSCDEAVMLDGSGLPRTRKKDARNHGFGVRSMSMIAEKYNGALAVSVEDGWFCLDVSIPVPTEVVGA